MYNFTHIETLLQQNMYMYDVWELTSMFGYIIKKLKA